MNVFEECVSALMQVGCERYMAETEVEACVSYELETRFRAIKREFSRKLESVSDEELVKYIKKGGAQ